MEKSDPPVPYTVEYSDLVLRHFRLLAREASARGDGPAFAAALKEFHRRLELFPQFGDPIVDLSVEEGQIRLAIWTSPRKVDTRLRVIGAVPFRGPARFGSHEQPRCWLAGPDEGAGPGSAFFRHQLPQPLRRELVAKECAGSRTGAPPRFARLRPDHALSPPNRGRQARNYPTRS